MNYSDIINVEKSHFSDIHSEFSHFINLLKHSEKLSEDTLQSIIIVNKKMQELSSDLQDINYLISKKKRKKNNKIKKEIDNYEKNDKVLKDLLPYILYYRFLLN